MRNYDNLRTASGYVVLHARLAAAYQEQAAHAARQARMFFDWGSHGAARQLQWDAAYMAGAARLLTGIDD